MFLFISKVHVSILLIHIKLIWYFYTNILYLRCISVYKTTMTNNQGRKPKISLIHSVTYVLQERTTPVADLELTLSTECTSVIKIRLIKHYLISIFTTYISLIICNCKLEEYLLYNHLPCIFNFHPIRQQLHVWCRH